MHVCGSDRTRNMVMICRVDQRKLSYLSLYADEAVEGDLARVRDQGSSQRGICRGDRKSGGGRIGS